MTLSLAVVCEAAADKATGCDLADRVVCKEVQWIEAEDLDHQRGWRGFAETDPFLRWASVPDLARQLGIKAHGPFDGRPGAPDAYAARRALLLLNAAERRPDAVVLLRDDDGQETRRNGLDDAKSMSGIGIPIVIGLAHPKRECWVLAGFNPTGPEEERLQSVRKELGFDPRENAERLTARHSGSKRDAKRVLALLTDGDHDRQAACWRDTDLEQLKARGQNTGLARYLEEVKERFLRLFTRGPEPDNPDP